MLYHYFAFTVKDNTKNKYPTVDDYEEWLSHARQHGVNIECYYYEIDQKDRLHMHGIMTAPKNIYKRQLLYKRMHQRIDEIQDQQGLIRFSDYIQKHYTTEEQYHQMLISYHIRHADYPYID